MKLLPRCIAYISIAGRAPNTPSPDFCRTCQPPPTRSSPNLRTTNAATRRQALVTDGFTATVCKHPKEWYLDGPVGVSRCETRSFRLCVPCQMACAAITRILCISSVYSTLSVGIRATIAGRIYCRQNILQTEYIAGRRGASSTAALLRFRFLLLLPICNPTMLQIAPRLVLVLVSETSWSAKVAAAAMLQSPCRDYCSDSYHYLFYFLRERAMEK
jgi:hypothetical protein